MSAPIFDRVCRDHGFAYIDRPLGTLTAPRVEKLPPLTVTDANDTRRKPTDADLLASIARTTQTLAAADECYRCPTDPAGRIDPLEPEPGLCRACLDEVSHAAEERRYREAAASLADDEWGE